MATVVSFRLEVNGQRASIQKVKALADEIATLERAIERFNTSSGGDVDKAVEKYGRLKKELEDIRQTLTTRTRNRLIDPQGTQETEAAIVDLTERMERVRAETRGAATELRQLTRIAKEAGAEGGEGFEELTQRIGQLRAEQKGVTREIQRQTAAFEEQNFAPGSYRQLQAQLGRLRGEFRDLGEEARESLGGRELLRNIQRTERQLSRLDNQMGLYFRNVGNYRDAIRGLTTAFRAFSAISVAGIGAREVVEQNARISDSIADVRKTTGLGRDALEGYNDEVVTLQENLEGIDTRTGLAELLDISRVGGQLGIVDEQVRRFERLRDAGDEAGAALALEEAREELEQFTIATDKVNVALGDDLPGGVDDLARSLGRLNVNLGVADQFENQSDGILAIGSAINELGGSTRATEANILDFTTRVAPLGEQANFAAADLIGFGAAIDELGVRPEAASTAFSNFALSLGQDVAGFAALAGQSEESFARLLGEEGGGAQAVIEVLRGVQEAGVELGEDGEATGGGVAALAEQLERLGVGDSARAAQTIGGLAGSLDNVIDRLERSQKAFDENTSIQEEFEEKNNNLAAAIQKLRNQFIALIVDADLQDFLQSAVEGFTSLVSRIPAFFVAIRDGVVGFVEAVRNGFNETVQFVQDFAVALAGVGLALVTLNAANIRAAALAARKLVVDKAQLVVELAKTVALRAQAVATNVVTVAQRVLNAVIRANPIGLLISAIFIAIGVFGAIARRSDEFRESIKAAFDRVNEFIKQFLGPFGIGIRFAISLLGVAIDAIANFGATFEGVRAAVGAIVNNITSTFQRLVNRAKIAGLQLRQALTFDDARDDAFQAQIDALEQANRQLADSAVDVAEAYETARDNAIALQEAEERAEAEAQRDAPADTTVDTIVTQSNIETDPEAEKKGEDEGREFGKGKSRAELDEERKLAEDRERLRLEAARKIRELEIKALGEGVEGQVAQANFSFENDLADVGGTEEQIEQQTALLRDQLFTSYEEIFSEARDRALELSAENLDAIGSSGGLLPEPEAIEAAVAEINEQLATDTARLFEEQEARLTEQGANEEAFTALAEQRAAFEEAQLDQQAANLQQGLELRRESLEQRQTLEEEQLAIDQANRRAAIFQQVEDEIITREEADVLLAEAREISEAEKLQQELEFLEARAALIEDDALALIENQRQIAELEAKITEEKVDRQLAAEDRLSRGRQAATQAGLRTLGVFIDTTQKLLEEDEENREKYGKALKALALAEIAVNLSREISAINAANTRFGEPFDTIIKVAAISAAVVKSAVQANTVRNQEFGEGGDALATMDRIDSLRAFEQMRPRGFQAMGLGGYIEDQPQGFFHGPLHRDGGLPFKRRNGGPVEVEGGEFYLHNGPERYVINRKSSRKFAPLLRSMSQGGATYDPERRAMASAINSFGGNGVKFQDGGAISISPSTSSLLNTRSIRPANLPGQEVTGSGDVSRELRRQNELLLANLAGVERQVDTLSRRTIEARALFDPAEATRVGLEQLSNE